jgi:hypothetical protein
VVSKRKRQGRASHRNSKDLSDNRPIALCAIARAIGGLQVDRASICRGRAEETSRHALLIGILARPTIGLDAAHTERALRTDELGRVSERIGAARGVVAIGHIDGCRRARGTVDICIAALILRG